MVKRKKGFSLEEFFEEKYKVSFSYIKESRNFIYLSIFVFFLFVLVGFFVPLPDYLNSQILKYLQDLVLKTKDFGLFDMVGFLFSNNSIASFFGLFLGIFFGIFPFLNALANGFFLGFVSKLAVSEGGIFTLWRLFPHGIFELPALFISLGLGLKLSTFMTKKEKLKHLRILLEKSITAYVFVVLPLLVIAAVIEGTLIVLGV